MVSIIDSLFFADVILVLGVSSAFMIPIVKFFSSKRIIVNVDGQEWKRAKWNKIAKKYLKLQERIAVKYSDVVIADNKVIQDNILENYRVKSELVAYGGSHVQKEEFSLNEMNDFGIRKPYYLSVCRIEPENNVHIILEAFSQTNEVIVSVGNWDASKYGKDLKSKFSEVQNIKLLDPIYDQKALDKLRSNCKVYVHGHSAGGTNPSLVEAMYLQLPVFAWNINYNRYTTHEKAFYFNDIQSLKSLVEENTEDDKLKNMALNLFQIARDNFDWKTIADAYQKLLER
jgi:glycosyltransferase involved in cell wall biosynthesis